MSPLRLPVLSVALLLSLAGATAAQAPRPSEADLLTGTWVLDLSRSTFFGRSPPKRQVMIFEPGEAGLEATVIFTDTHGVENRVSYTLGADNERIPLQGSENFDAIFMESRGPYLAVTTFTHAGREVGHAERRISLDGREMTVEVERNGNLSSRAIFIKQE